MKITMIVTKSLHQDCGLCYLHLPFFFLYIHSLLLLENNFFFNCYLAAPRPTLGHYRGDSLTHPMLITAFLHFRPEGHREPRSKVGSLSPAEHLVGFEPGIFRFLLQHLNPLGHSPQIVVIAIFLSKLDKSLPSYIYHQSFIEWGLVSIWLKKATHCLQYTMLI